MHTRLALVATVLVAVLLQAAPAVGAPAFDPGRLVVRYDPAASAQAAALEAELGATLVEEIQPLGIRVIEVPPARSGDVLAALRAEPTVRLAERDPVVDVEEVSPDDSLLRSQWSLVRTGASRAWGLSVGSPTVVVAVLDTGVDPTHPDIQGKLVGGNDVVNGDSDPADDHGHGTAVAGIAAAATNNATGIAGMCWRCPIMPVKVLDANGVGTDSQAAAGIVWAVDHGARVVNMSFGGPQSSATLAAAVQYAHSRGVVLVAAAGNAGTTTPTYPAAYPEVLAVAGTDENDTLYEWSSRGAWTQLAAPGTNAATWPGSGYRWFTGTSSAAPVVAGIAGLAFAAAPGVTAGDVQRALTSTAVAVPGVAHGRVDAHATVAQLTAPPARPPSPVPAGPEPTDSAPPPTQPTPTPPRVKPDASHPAAVPPATKRRVVDGALRPGRKTRSVRMRVAGGPTKAVVVAPPGVRLTLTLQAANGRVVARTSGTRRVQLNRTLPQGVYRYIVAGEPTRSASFRLVLTHRAPAR